MPKGPKGEKRPADVIGNAVKVMRIAVGEEADDVLFAVWPENRKAVALAISQAPSTSTITARCGP